MCVILDRTYSRRMGRPSFVNLALHDLRSSVEMGMHSRPLHPIPTKIKRVRAYDESRRSCGLHSSWFFPLSLVTTRLRSRPKTQVTVITARADALSEAAVFFDALAAISCVYTLFAALQVLRLAGAVKATPCLRNRHFVSVLKPLCSAEPRLYENLKTFCKQDYAGELEILFGVANPTDPAVAVVERLMHDIGSEPHRMLKLVVTGGVSTATNDKVANLVGIARAARGEIFIMLLGS